MSRARKALVVWGGMELHTPERGAHVVRELLEAEGFAVTVTGDYEALGADDVGSNDLVVPVITDGTLAPEDGEADRGGPCGDGAGRISHGTGDELSQLGAVSLCGKLLLGAASGQYHHLSGRCVRSSADGGDREFRAHIRAVLSELRSGG